METPEAPEQQTPAAAAAPSVAVRGKSLLESLRQKFGGKSEAKTPEQIEIETLRAENAQLKANNAEYEATLAEFEAFTAEAQAPSASPAAPASAPKSLQERTAAIKAALPAAATAEAVTNELASVGIPRAELPKPHEKAVSQVDTLQAQLRAETDPEKRSELYRELTEAKAKASK